MIGIWHIASRLFMRRGVAGKGSWRALLTPPPGRGDFSVWLAAVCSISGAAMSTIGTAWWLLHQANLAGLGSPVTTRLLGVLVFYSLIYTPIIGYVGARLEGIVGQNVEVPYIREAARILTGYRGAAIWFIPMPSNNYGNQALYFRKTELTGTKISSMVKAELFVFPVTVVAMVVFSHFIWKIAPVPSSAFPYADQWWELAAYRQGLCIRAR